MLSDVEMYARMAKGWRMGRDDGTVCGNGSTLANTANIRHWLPEITRTLGIVSVCDAGAGDLHWVSRLQWHVQYRAYDLIPRKASVEKSDITSYALPKCDAILCRMVLNHLDEPRILRALKLFRQAARYLIATQFDGEDLPQRSPQFTRLDLRREPYNLGDPLASVQDGAEDICSLAVWAL